MNEIKEQENSVEEQEALQEAYYYHVIAEFYGMIKFFGQEKVMKDLLEFGKTVEKPVEKSLLLREEKRIQLL